MVRPCNHLYYMRTLSLLSSSAVLSVVAFLVLTSCERDRSSLPYRSSGFVADRADSIRLWDTDRRGLPEQVLSLTDSLLAGLDSIPAGEQYTYALYIRGKSLFKLGAYEESIQTMGRVVQRGSPNTEMIRNARLFAAHGLRACNDTLGALALYRACLRYSSVIEASRNADALANIAMIERWLGRKDSAVIHAQIARSSFESVGDTSGVEWTERIIRGVAHNTLPHPRQPVTIRRLPAIRSESIYPHPDLVMDIVVDGNGMKWMATLLGLVRDLGFGVEWPQAEGVEVTQAFTDLIRETDSTILAKAIGGGWIRVHVEQMGVSECPPPRKPSTRINADVPSSLVNDLGGTVRTKTDLPPTIDANLVTRVLMQDDSTSVICLRDRGALLWEHHTNKIDRIFSYGEAWTAGILDVRDVFRGQDRWGALSVRGIAWERLTRKNNRTTLSNTYRDGSAIHAYRFHRIGASLTIIECDDHKSLLIDSTVIRIPAKGIDTSMRWPDRSWMISGIRKNDSVLSVSIGLDGGSLPEFTAEALRFSPLTANDVAWHPIQYAIDDQQWRPLEANGWVNLRDLDFGTHIVGIQWADGSATTFIPVFSSTRWWATWWGRISLTIAFALFVTVLVWFVMRRRMNLRLEQQQRIHDERDRISRDLHDHVGSQLARMSTIASRIEKSSDPIDRDVLLKRLQQSSREATRSLRDVLTISQGGTSTLQDVIAVLRERLRELAGDVQVSFLFDIDNQIHKQLSGEQRHHLVMFVMEAVTNAVRHGESAAISMILQQQNNRTELLLVDDGSGRTAQDRIGLGTATMEHRAAILGATVTWEPGTQGGTVVRLVWR